MESLRRPRLTPAIADVRRAVREGLLAAFEAPDAADSPLVLVALSGGADSLALAAATAFEAPRAGLRAGAVVIDHGLQDGSAAIAARAAEQARGLGLDPVHVVAVAVGDEGGMEAAARAARYAAFARLQAEAGASGILLGHTLDDQAETVLLGLARGSGPTSMHGMAAQTGPYLRPLLGIRRADTVQFCADAGLEPWRDPHNADPAYARVRVRDTVLPVLEAELGPGIAEALARTAEQLREDSAALDEMVLEFIEEICEPAEAGIAVSAAALAANPAALRQRVIRFVVQSEFGVTLERVHTLAVARLVTDWHGQKALNLPGVRVERSAGLLVFTAA
ncbi:tRNA lysidine(34) synthetase TilS [Microterricola pindariensis]|uniref:tRNA(Ile)-lysidine synthase n=1 Tax=Microterricola pindariensis TaxID=478010 RepID=A0ABX5AY80_9MICO|nr:tRNA lysidine(34) synthetase TilS [Microterricola pindariensis]PPL19873.1 tRNA lysidine(34) synthetase TilS [Microterricola pindariensis]